MTILLKASPPAPLDVKWNMSNSMHYSYHCHRDARSPSHLNKHSGGIELRSAKHPKALNGDTRGLDRDVAPATLLLPPHVKVLALVDDLRPF